MERRTGLGVIAAALAAWIAHSGCHGASADGDAAPDPDAPHTGPDARSDAAPPDDAPSDADLLDAAPVDAPWDAALADAAVPDAPWDAAPPPPVPDVLYVADQDVDTAHDLFYVPSGGSPVRVNAPVSADMHIAPTWARAAQRIVYLAYLRSFGGLEAATVSLVGGLGSPVTLNGPLVTNGKVGLVRLSPDATRAVYTAQEEQYGRYDLYVVDLSSGTPTAGVRVNDPSETGGYGVVEARWSPDGTRIAFQTDSGDHQLFVADVRTTPVDATPIDAPSAGQGVYETEFAWSPDGRWIAYVADQDTAAIRELYAVDVSGAAPAAPRKLHPAITESAHSIRRFEWSPDGVWLAYWVDPSACDPCAFDAVRMAGAEPAAPVPIATLASGEFVRWGFRWAPDSSALAYQVTTGATTQLHVASFTDVEVGASHVVNGPLAPGGTVELTGPGVEAFRWSPDGARLAYVAREDLALQPQLYVTTVTNGVPATPVVVNQDLPYPAFVRAYFLWTPDSERLLYLADVTTLTSNELFAVDVASGPPSPPLRLSGPFVSGGGIAYTGAYHAPFVLLDDGAWVAYIADADFDERFELYASHVATGAPTVVKLNAPLIPTGDVVTVSP